MLSKFGPGGHSGRQNITNAGDTASAVDDLVDERPPSRTVAATHDLPQRFVSHAAI